VTPILEIISRIVDAGVALVQCLYCYALQPLHVLPVSRVSPIYGASHEPFAPMSLDEIKHANQECGISYIYAVNTSACRMEQLEYALGTSTF
jgi:hypothetical protein